MSPLGSRDSYYSGFSKRAVCPRLLPLEGVPDAWRTGDTRFDDIRSHFLKFAGFWIGQVSLCWVFRDWELCSCLGSASIDRLGKDERAVDLGRPWLIPSVSRVKVWVVCMYSPPSSPLPVVMPTCSILQPFRPSSSTRPQSPIVPEVATTLPLARAAISPD